VFDFLRRRPSQNPQPAGSLERLSNLARTCLTADAAKELQASQKLPEFLRLASGIVPADSLIELPLAKHVVYSLASGYSPAETVLHAFKLTLAVRLTTSAGDDIVKLLAMSGAAVSGVKQMAKWRDSGAIRSELFENDLKAITGMVYPSPASDGWIKKVMIEYSSAP
jgi:hypothetical protein